MRINKISVLVSLAITSGLCLAHPENASATAMNLSYEQIGSTTTVSNGVGTNFTQLPASAVYGNTLGPSTGDVPGATGFSFYDDYVFTVAAATVDSVTTAIDLGSTLSVSNLEERIYSTAGNSPLPIVGTPAGFSTDWTSPIAFTAATESGMQTVVNPTMLAAGTYVLEVRGEVSGTSGGSYSGVLDLNPVPLPAALPLLLSGIGLLGGLVRKRRS
jgi:hypothetical protein